MKKTEGFTILEIMFVLFLIGMLSLITIPRLRHRNEKAKKIQSQMELKLIQKAIENYHEDNGVYPDNDEGLKVLVHPYKMYLPDSSILQDPWGKAYDYKFKDDSDGYCLICYGRDGLSGGTGDNKDLIIDK